MGEKKRIIKNLDNLVPEQQLAFQRMYPTGYDNNIIRLSNAKREIFFAVTFETEEVLYMVKVSVNTPKDDDEQQPVRKPDDDLNPISVSNADNANEVNGHQSSYHPDFDELD